MRWLPIAMPIAGLAAVICHITVLIWMSRRPRREDVLAARVDRLREALALLTDTTETGLSVVGGQIERVQSWGPRAVVRTPVVADTTRNDEEDEVETKAAHLPAHERGGAPAPAHEREAAHAPAHEIEAMGRPQIAPVPVVRGTIGARVAAAAEDGDTVTEIARRESLSEGEVRLHLALARYAARTGGGHGHVRA